MPSESRCARSFNAARAASFNPVPAKNLPKYSHHGSAPGAAMRRLFITLAIVVVIVMFLAAAIVRFEPAVVVASCWPNKAMLAIAVASASVGCCLGVVTGLFAGGGDHGR
jgi:hypothetical protein